VSSSSFETDAIQFYKETIFSRQVEWPFRELKCETFCETISVFVPKTSEAKNCS
jgi:hypothetical protein